MQIDLQGVAPLLQVFDMPTSLRFYRDMLGFQVAYSSGDGDDVDWVMLRLNAIELMLNTAYEKFMRPLGPDTKRIEAHDDTVLYFGCADVDATYRILLDKGLNLEKPKITGYGWKAIQIKDPDNFLLVFHCPSPN
jgi:glyoxylase I family protein